MSRGSDGLVVGCVDRIDIRKDGCADIVDYKTVRTVRWYCRSSSGRRRQNIWRATLMLLLAISVYAVSRVSRRWMVVLSGAMMMIAVVVVLGLRRLPVRLGAPGLQRRLGRAQRVHHHVVHDEHGNLSS